MLESAPILPTLPLGRGLVCSLAVEHRSNLYARFVCATSCWSVSTDCRRNELSRWLLGAEIVPPHLRNMIYAFDRSFEMAIAACGAPLVGILAERVFGFTVRPYPC